jgi:small ligand-binding sensory domain FIST
MQQYHAQPEDGHFNVRRADNSDLRALTALISTCGGPGKFRELYGSYNFASMLQCGYLCLVATAEEVTNLLQLLQCQTRDLLVL